VTYTVEFSRPARKRLGGLPENIRVRLARAIDALADNPRPIGVEKLSGYADRYRIREGDYRIVYTIHDTALVVLVVGVGHRKDIYR